MPKLKSKSWIRRNWFFILRCCRRRSVCICSWSHRVCVGCSRSSTIRSSLSRWSFFFFLSTNEAKWKRPSDSDEKCMCVSVYLCCRDDRSIRFAAESVSFWLCACRFAVRIYRFLSSFLNGQRNFDFEQFCFFRFKPKIDPNNNFRFYSCISSLLFRYTIITIVALVVVVSFYFHLNSSFGSF